MAYISYKKLWHQLIDRDISKTALRSATGISSSTLANMGNERNVSLEVLLKICVFLHCDLSDIAEVKYEGNEDNCLMCAEQHKEYNVNTK